MCVKHISLTVLEDFSTLEQFLLALDISKTRIKKELSGKKRQQIITARSEINIPIDLINYNLIAPFDHSWRLEILQERDDIIAFKKPANIHSYPLRYSDQQTALNALLSYRPSLVWVNSFAADRGLLYRLDFATSGVLLYAKNNYTYKSVRQAFNKQTVKIYYAVVSGKIAKSGELQHALSPFGPKGAKMVVSSTGQAATLSFERVEYDSKQDCSLVKVQLFSGIRHQIRVQLAAIGHPICGDALYGGREAQRLLLHAYSYQIPSIDSTVFSCPLPELFWPFI